MERREPRASRYSVFWVAFAFHTASFLYFIYDCGQKHFLSISRTRPGFSNQDQTVESKSDVVEETKLSNTDKPGQVVHGSTGG